MLVAKLNETMLKRDDILELIGGVNNIGKMKDNHDNHLRFVASILQTPNSETLVDTLLWVFRSFMSRGFSSNYWEVQINTLLQLLKKTISEKAFLEILSIYDWINANRTNFKIAAEEEIEKAKNNDQRI